MSYARQTQTITYSKKHRLPEKTKGKELLKSVRPTRTKKVRLQ